MDEPETRPTAQRMWAIQIAGGDIARAKEIVGYVWPRVEAPAAVPEQSRANWPRAVTDIVCDEYPKDTKIKAIRERVQRETGLMLTGAQVHAITFRRVNRSPQAQVKHAAALAAANAASAAKRNGAEP